MKESKKYKQQEEETTKVSEPVVAYNSMAYLELEAEKAAPCQLTEDEIKEEIEQAIDEIQQGQIISSQEMHTTFKHYLL